MPTNLRWVASVSASCFHAAAAVDAGRSLVEPKLATALAPGVESLGASFDASGVARQRFLRHLAPLSAGIEYNRELRASPMMEQWEARGPGLLASVGRLTEADLVVDAADVILVYPALGGGGEAHLAYNSARIEAVLANPHAQLPEVVRLAWLISQLSLDLPKYSEKFDGVRLPRVAALAMIPPVLSAAEQVELARYDDATLRLALQAWGVADADAENVAGTLDTWWRTYTEAPMPFAVALEALDKMLG